MRPSELRQTPQKNTSRSHKKKLFDQELSKDLLCPFIDTFSATFLPGLTPLRKQPQYLLSPSPIKKDLFSQLLGTQTKHLSPVQYQDQIIEEEGMMSISQMSSDQDSMIQQCSSDNQANWSDQNGIKKRKRKSTAQIKLLKQQLDGQMNWTKQKIVKMAEITGLSQSQVYKWCWDQKKKQNKGSYEMCKNLNDRRKLIKKNLSYRQNSYRLEQEDEQDQNQYKQNIKQGCNVKRTMTKLKTASTLTDTNQTQKKVNKRLIFF